MHIPGAGFFRELESRWGRGFTNVVILLAALAVALASLYVIVYIAGRAALSAYGFVAPVVSGVRITRDTWVNVVGGLVAALLMALVGRYVLGRFAGIASQLAAQLGPIHSFVSTRH